MVAKSYFNNGFSWYYYFPLIVLLFFSVKTSAKLQHDYEQQQQKNIEIIEKSITDPIAKAEFLKMQDNHETKNEISNMIENLNQIKDKNQFFKFINSTGSLVICHSMVLNINNQINIHPLTYNTIGNDIIAVKMPSIEIFNEASLNKIMQIQFKDMFKNKKFTSEFEKKLNALSKLSLKEKQKFMKKLITKYGNLKKNFDGIWKNVTEEYKIDMNETMGKFFPNMISRMAIDDEILDIKKFQNLTFEKAIGIAKTNDTIEFKKLIDKISDSRKEVFFRTSAWYKNITDKLERSLADGKTVEEWEFEILQAENDTKRAETASQSLIKAKQLREFRKAADAFILADNGNNNQRAFIESYITETIEKYLNETKNAKTNESRIAAKENLNIFKMVSKAFYDGINHTEIKIFKNATATFTFGQNERFVYQYDIDSVIYTLNQVLKNATENATKLFRNMSIEDYDRLNRVMNQYYTYKIILLQTAIIVAQDRKISRIVESASDVACIIEAIVQMKDYKNLLEPNITEYYNSLSTGTGPNYAEFIKEIVTRLSELKKNINPKIIAKWTSPLNMVYHFWKHSKQFNATLHQFFNEIPDFLFIPAHATPPTLSQTGSFRQTYLGRFGNLLHIGFVKESPQKIASHYILS